MNIKEKINNKEVVVSVLQATQQANDIDEIFTNQMTEMSRKRNTEITNGRFQLFQYQPRIKSYDKWEIQQVLALPCRQVHCLNDE